MREILGVAIGPSEAEPFWTEFLRSLSRRGLDGVKLVIADAHPGLKAAAAKVLGGTIQRCKGFSSGLRSGSSRTSALSCLSILDVR